MASASPASDWALPSSSSGTDGTGTSQAKLSASPWYWIWTVAQTVPAASSTSKRITSPDWSTGAGGPPPREQKSPPQAHAGAAKNNALSAQTSVFMAGASPDGWCRRGSNVSTRRI